MVAYEGSESARDNFSKFIYQFQPETKLRHLSGNSKRSKLNYIDKICLYYLMKHIYISEFSPPLSISCFLLFFKIFSLPCIYMHKNIFVLRVCNTSMHFYGENMSIKFIVSLF